MAKSVHRALHLVTKFKLTNVCDDFFFAFLALKKMFHQPTNGGFNPQTPAYATEFTNLC